MSLKFGKFNQHWRRFTPPQKKSFEIKRAKQNGGECRNPNLTHEQSINMRNQLGNALSCAAFATPLKLVFQSHILGTGAEYLSAKAFHIQLRLFPNLSCLNSRILAFCLHKICQSPPPARSSLRTSEVGKSKNSRANQKRAVLIVRTARCLFFLMCVITCAQENSI